MPVGAGGRPFAILNVRSGLRWHLATTIACGYIYSMCLTDIYIYALRLHKRICARTCVHAPTRTPRHPNDPRNIRTPNFPD
jgi:hypothetical protein